MTLALRIVRPYCGAHDGPTDEQIGRGTLRGTQQRQSGAQDGGRRHASGSGLLHHPRAVLVGETHGYVAGVAAGWIEALMSHA